MEIIGSRLGAHVNVRSRGRSLLSVIHRGIHANLFERLGSWGRDGIADRQVDRSSGGDYPPGADAA
jgi:hypothetical protein